jgi:PIN domain nuclease of toxin-antitoxin system
VIVLDTHAWIWHVTESDRLSKSARAHIKREEALGVHPISCWEVATLVERGRLRFQQSVAQWVELAVARPKIELLGCSAAAAVRAAQLGDTFPADPADRLIVAAALEANVPLVTKDERIREWGGIKVIW